MSEWLINGACFLGALVGMEWVAWATHRYVMHGPLWVLHRSHHEPRHGAFELNDLFAVIFAGMAIGLFALGSTLDQPWMFWTAAGITAYGALYALVHDGLVHQRWPFRYTPRKGYFKRLVQAHRMHHAVKGKEDGVSFGFLLPGDVRRFSAELRQRRLERAGSDPRP
nr:sterol desaturase family protein [uncultured Brevundimonas sp.]